MHAEGIERGEESLIKHPRKQRFAVQKSEIPYLSIAIKTKLTSKVIDLEYVQVNYIIKCMKTPIVLLVRPEANGPETAR